MSSKIFNPKINKQKRFRNIDIIEDQLAKSKDENYNYLTRDEVQQVKDENQHPDIDFQEINQESVMSTIIRSKLNEVNVDEFTSFSDQQLQEQFTLFDVGISGQLDHKSMRKMGKMLKIEETQMSEILSEIDEKQNGRISFQDWVKYIRNKLENVHKPIHKTVNPSIEQNQIDLFTPKKNLNIHDDEKINSTDLEEAIKVATHKHYSFEMNKCNLFYKFLKENDNIIKNVQNENLNNVKQNISNNEIESHDANLKNDLLENEIDIQDIDKDVNEKKYEKIFQGNDQKIRILNNNPVEHNIDLSVKMPLCSMFNKKLDLATSILMESNLNNVIAKEDEKLQNNKKMKKEKSTDVTKEFNKIKKSQTFDFDKFSNQSRVNQFMPIFSPDSKLFKYESGKYKKNLNFYGNKIIQQETKYLD